MAKKKTSEAETNMFADYAKERKAEQAMLAKKVTTDGEPRTVLSLSITVTDKKMLKMMAAERDTTIAAIIHEWVAEHTERVSK